MTRIKSSRLTPVSFNPDRVKVSGLGGFLVRVPTFPNPHKNFTMEKNVSIVKVDKRHYRVIARENWGLTKEQMKGKHVHHRIKRSDGGTNDPSNLYVCSEWFHGNVWHGDEGGFTGLIIKGARNGGIKGGGWNKGIPHSSGHAKNISRSLMGNTRRKGCTISDYQKECISKANKNKPKSETQKRKISNANKGRKHWVCESGELKFQKTSPGPEWQNGRRWVPGKT